MKNPATLHPSAMIQEPTPLWGRLSERLFRHLELHPDSVDELRELSERGQVVYIMRSRSLVDYLAFNRLFARHNLPLARFANGLNLSVLRGFRSWIINFFRSAPSTEEALQEPLSHGDAALLFLRERRWGRSRRMSPGHIQKLISFQRTSERSLYLIPQLIYWHPAPPTRQRGIWDFLFGDTGEPGRLRKFVQLLRYAKRASVRVGHSINLKELIEHHPTWSDERLARKIGRMMIVNLGREAMAIHGPPRKSPDQIKFEIMERRSLTREMKRLHEETDEPLAVIEGRARRYLDEIASKPKYKVQMAIARSLDWLFFRVFNGVEVDQAGLQRVKEAAKDSRDAPLILIPSHKSHVDYLVVAWVFIRNGFIVPYTAAGANLSFFPLGPLLRNACAFFLRRSFVGLDLYKTVFKHYVWKLVREGYPVEFFIEGGRTRTGKLLSPKMGLLSIILEGVQRGEYKDLQFIPINLSYERVVETASYRKELVGGEKKSENIRGVLNASKVLRSRYGRIYVDFESPVRLSEYLVNRDEERVPQSDDEFKAFTERLAFYIMHRIQEVTVIAPSSLVGFVLLSHERRGLPAERLKRLVGFLTTFAVQSESRLSASILSALKRNEARITRREREGGVAPFVARGEALTFLIDESLVLLKRLIDKVERNNQVIYVVPEKHRIELDYYRNSILGLFAPEAILCTVVASHRGGVTWDRLLTDARWLSELLKLEFIYRNDQPFQEIVSGLMTKLKGAGVVIEERGLFYVGLQEEAMLFCSSLRHFLECYWVAAHTLKSTARSPIEGKAWVKSAVEQADLAALQGEIRRVEASSSVALANALQWFVRQGWVKEESTTEGRKRIKRYQVQDPEAFEGFFNRLAQVLADLPDGPPPMLSPLKHLEDQKLIAEGDQESPDERPDESPDERPDERPEEDSTGALNADNTTTSSAEPTPEEEDR